MKLRTAVISIVVSAALVGGAGYGAYYTMQGQKTPVEVVPVSNVMMGYWGWNDQQTIYGSVTSQVAQTVRLNDQYPIEEIYVSVGDDVREGTPLFSYDMTLPELELEMAKLKLQTGELTMTKLEKELEKLKKTPTTASLERVPFTLTASAEEISIDDLVIEELEEPGTPTDSVDDVGSQPDGEEDSASGDEVQKSEGASSSEEAIGIEIEGMEEFSNSDTEDKEIKDTTVVDSVDSYEQLVLAIDSLFRSYGDGLKAEEVGDAISDAVAYYRKNLADEQVVKKQNEGGSPEEVRAYTIKDSVRAALGEEEIARLETICEKMDQYQVRYVEMLIEETSHLESSELSEAVEQIRDAYNLLATKQRSEVQNLEEFRELETLVQQDSGIEVPEESETETESETEVQEEFETESEPQTESETHTETEISTESETQTEPGTETPAESENQTEMPAPTESETQTETESQEQYVLTIQYPAVKTELHKAGEIIVLQADMSDITLEFAGWKVTPVPEDMTEDVMAGTATFAMPASDVSAEAQYRNAPEAIESYIQNFEAYAESLLAKNAEKRYKDKGKDYLTELENAIVFYQQWLATLPAEILEDTAGMTEAEFEKYELKKNVKRYLKKQDKKALIKQLQNDYKELCLVYVKTMFQHLDADAIDKELLDRVGKAYNLLGNKWRAELEERWRAEQAEQMGQTGETDEDGEPIAPVWIPAIGDMIEAYKVLYMFQEYQNMDPETSEEERYLAVQQIWNAYQNLTVEQRAFAAGCPELVDVLQGYGFWEDFEPESEPWDWWDGDGNDGFDEPMYTASELKEMIEEVEQEIKDCALDIRQMELEVKQKQRVVDGKIVKSTMDGTVINIGGPDGNSDEDYFVKVANESGLYVRGSMNELALEKLNVGDAISGMLMNDGTSFTAVIKEVSDYPDANGGGYSYGENSNASYYPFYALIDDAEDMGEGEAEIYLSASAANGGDAIYLENYFIRTESDGRNYVYKQGKDGLLAKQYVKTGKSMYGYALEIVEGLELTDMIAFPYGKNVEDGAKTKEVDMLQEAYM